MAVNESADCREDAACELINSAKILQSNRLDLSRRRILQLPPSLLELTKLEFLYLEGNLLTELPETLFEQLISLKWLDLRNNKLINLPLNVRKQRCLRSLLLDGNNLKSLPVELGFVHSLTGLHLAGNPLDFPPKHVVDKGTQEILKFLRDQVPGDEAEITQELDDEKQGPIKEVKRHVDKLSITQKYDKHHQFTRQNGYMRKQSVESRMQEELVNMEKREFNDKADAIIQKRKDKQTRSDWQQEARRMKRHKESLARMKGLEYNSPEPPFGTETQQQPPLTKHAQQVRDALKNKERPDLSGNDDLMLQIRKHIAGMEERRRSEKKVSVEEEVEQARRNLEEALQLQRKLEEKRALEYRLRAFTADDFFPPKHAAVKPDKSKKQ